MGCVAPGKKNKEYEECSLNYLDVAGTGAGVRTDGMHPQSRSLVCLIKVKVFQ